MVGFRAPPRRAQPPWWWRRRCRLRPLQQEGATLLRLKKEEKGQPTLTTRRTSGEHVRHALCHRGTPPLLPELHFADPEDQPAAKRPRTQKGDYLAMTEGILYRADRLSNCWHCGTQLRITTCLSPDCQKHYRDVAGGSRRYRGRHQEAVRQEPCPQLWRRGIRRRRRREEEEE